MATLLKVLNNLADIKSAGVLHFALELRTVRTPLWEKRAVKDPEVLETLRRWYPLGRVVEPVDIARAVAFLASDAASAITGVALPVDYGLTSGNILMRRDLTLEDL
jgi:NAD(P)-dependent dehydrogenase (short-subunit alcohol dehydrogenase family)